jgi:hypothetical protein
MEIKEMIRQCEGNEKSVMKVSRWMLDQGNLEMNASGMLVWIK